jgi:hypothetical protein
MAVGIALPRFHVQEIARQGASVILRGTVSSTGVGQETWIGDRYLGYLKRGDFLAPGRWHAAPGGWDFTLEREEDLGEINGARDMEVLDGYWGERAELVLDTGIVWKADRWTTPGDHDHCAICWATIADRDNADHFVATTGARVCCACHRDHVGRRGLGFIHPYGTPRD